MRICPTACLIRSEAQILTQKASLTDFCSKNDENSVFDTFQKNHRNVYEFLFCFQKKNRTTWTLRIFIFFPEFSGISSGDFYDKQINIFTKGKPEYGNLEWDDGNPGISSETTIPGISSETTETLEL